VAQRPDELRRQIEETRERMGDTVDALGYKADVPARTRGWVGDKKDALLGRKDDMVDKLGNATGRIGDATGRIGDATGRIGDVTPDTEAMRRRGGMVKDTAERNPLGLAIAGAAVGFLGGLLAPSTRIESEKVGPMADDLKSTAAEKGREALEHGREVVRATAETAVETAREQGRQHGEELVESVRGEQEQDERPAPSSTPTSEWPNERPVVPPVYGGRDTAV
jgi:hypothetical protein